MGALARANTAAPFHPIADETRDALCVTGRTRPTLSFFDRKIKKKERNDLVGYYCDEYAPSTLQGNAVTCSPGDGENSVVLSTQVGDNFVDCGFTLALVDECPSKADRGMGSSDKSDSGSASMSDSADGSSMNSMNSDDSAQTSRKRQADPRCSERRSRDECLGTCDPTGPLTNCECVYDVLDNGMTQQEDNDLDAPCVGGQCCWEPPCSRYDTGSANDCALFSGGELVFDGMEFSFVGNRCEQNDQGLCRCKEPSTTADDLSTAPFDCDCPTLDAGDEFLSGVCPLDERDPQQLLAEKETALALSLQFGRVNVVNFVKQCKVDVIRIARRNSNDAKVAAELSQTCFKLQKLFFRNKIDQYREALDAGCDFIFNQGEAAAAYQLAEDELPAEDLDALSLTLAEQQLDASRIGSASTLVAGSLTALVAFVWAL